MTSTFFLYRKDGCFPYKIRKGQIPQNSKIVAFCKSKSEKKKKKKKK